LFEYSLVYRSYVSFHELTLIHSLPCWYFSQEGPLRLLWVIIDANWLQYCLEWKIRPESQLNQILSSKSIAVKSTASEYMREVRTWE